MLLFLIQLKLVCFFVSTRINMWTLVWVWLHHFPGDGQFTCIYVILLLCSNLPCIKDHDGGYFLTCLRYAFYLLGSDETVGQFVVLHIHSFSSFLLLNFATAEIKCSSRMNLTSLYCTDEISSKLVVSIKLYKVNSLSYSCRLSWS